MKTQSLIALAVIAFAAAARAEQVAVPVHPALNAPFYFTLGAFYPSTTTQAQLTGKATGAGTVLDLEQSFDIERHKMVPSFSARWRVNYRWRVEADYFEMNRDSTRTIDRQIEWGDQVFPVNTQVSTTFNFSDLRVSTGYSLFRTADKELGIGLGLHFASYEASLASSTGGGGQGEDVTAPLPVLSLYGQFALTDRWAVGTRLDRFSLKYDRYDGGLTALNLDVLYQPFRHVGFGAGYRGLFVKLEVEGDRALAKFRQSFEGPTVYMNVSF